MKKLTFALCVLLTGSSYASEEHKSSTVGNAEAGKAKSAICAACHGADGNSVAGTWPKLAGQNAGYIVQELQKFKSGARENASMTGMVANLTPEDMADLAAYFSSQTRTQGAASEALVAAGQKIYRGGDKAKGVPACSACHSPQGNGNPAAKYPALGGQHAEYVKKQLEDYRSGVRSGKVTEGTPVIMREIASKLSDDEIKAVADYVAGLH
jgi:cytochrome c553